MPTLEDILTEEVKDILTLMKQQDTLDVDINEAADECDTWPETEPAICYHCDGTGCKYCGWTGHELPEEEHIEMD